MHCSPAAGPRVLHNILTSLRKRHSKPHGRLRFQVKPLQNPPGAFLDLAHHVIGARANADRTGRVAEFDAALDAFCDEWNRGTAEEARFEQEYLVSVGRPA